MSGWSMDSMRWKLCKHWQNNVTSPRLIWANTLYFIDNFFTILYKNFKLFKRFLSRRSFYFFWKNNPRIELIFSDGDSMPALFWQNHFPRSLSLRKFTWLFNFECQIKREQNLKLFQIFFLQELSHIFQNTVLGISLLKFDLQVSMPFLAWIKSLGWEQKCAPSR